MTNKEKMLAGKLYIAADDELREDVTKGHILLEEFNRSNYEEFAKRNQIIKKLFRKTGENVSITRPFYADYGCNITVGENFYANTDCIFLDVNEIIIGDNVMLAPRVSLYTAGHPIDKDIRNEQLEYGYKIVIGNDVWIGGNVVVNPGVTIGSNVVIGSGSVVTKDIPSGVVACGNPCHVLRTINIEDKLLWEKQKEEYYKTK